MERTDLPPAWDERTMLQTFLDYTRDTAVMKCADLGDEAARATPLPGSPLMSIAGVVNHLRWVEHSWIEVRFLGGQDRGPWTDEEPDREFSIVTELSLAEVIDGYRTTSARCDALVADVDLDVRARSPIRSGDLVTLRWIMHHLIEETARHNGHLDLLREMADGTTGD